MGCPRRYCSVSFPDANRRVLPLLRQQCSVSFDKRAAGKLYIWPRHNHREEAADKALGWSSRHCYQTALSPCGSTSITKTIWGGHIHAPEACLWPLAQFPTCILFVPSCPLIQEVELQQLTLEVKEEFDDIELAACAKHETLAAWPGKSVRKSGSACQLDATLSQ